MSTAAFESVNKIPLRVAELRSLSSRARQFEESDEAVYNAMCRACAVLIASHLEGAIKDVCDSVRIDLNFYLKEFRKLPASLKRDFCRKIAFYEGVPSKEIDTRTLQLIAFFDKNSVPVELDAFPYLANPNKNSSPTVVDRSFERFGVTGSLAAIGSEFLLSTFSEDAKKHYAIGRELRRCRSNLFNFPYQSPTSSLFCEIKKGNNENKGVNLWHTFLEEILTRRHQIAHGDTMENPTTADQLDLDISKMEVLLYALAFYFCGRLSSLLKE